MKLSIVVPVYNVEAFLKKCVNSLLVQDLPKDDYEIILVDDGSTDDSGALCDALAAEQGNIRVIHQQNRGLSGARNTGIAVAKGVYIQFVDSDDFLESNVLGGLVKRVENNDLDILRFNYQNVFETGGVFEPNKYAKPFVDFSGEVCDGVTGLRLLCLSVYVQDIPTEKGWEWFQGRDLLRGRRMDAEDSHPSR